MQIKTHWAGSTADKNNRNHPIQTIKTEQTLKKKKKHDWCPAPGRP